MKGYHLIILLGFFIALSANVYSQNESTLALESTDVVQQEAYQKLRDKLDFSETKSVWKLKEKEPKEKKEDISMPDINPSSGINFNGGFLNIIAYMLILVLLMAVIYMVFSNVRTDKKIDEIKQSDDRIEDIEAIDTIDGFKQALMAGDYRSAIRMQFIKVLQLLQENKDINWKPEKTNKDYLRELSATDQTTNFRNLSGIYELVWYGNTIIDRENFEHLNPSFEKFINGFNGK